jgi:hypothetical protein
MANCRANFDVKTCLTPEACSTWLPQLLAQVPTVIGRDRIPIQVLQITLYADYYIAREWGGSYIGYDFPFRDTWTLSPEEGKWHLTYTEKAPVWTTAGFNPRDFDTKNEAYTGTTEQIVPTLCDFIAFHAQEHHRLVMRITLQFDNATLTGPATFPEFPGGLWFRQPSDWATRTVSWGTEAYMPTVRLSETVVERNFDEW